MQKTPESLPAKESRVYATPPLYMKVKGWEAEGAKLIYEGKTVHGLVEVEGDKKAQIQSIYSKQEVIITNTNHSSSFFYPEEEERLQVYVTPIDKVLDWIIGIPVFGKDLYPAFE